ncbi:hypothetical protein B712_0463 [Chlamydia psittaci NJ1]|nr:hypothetical protein B712_0463 [Chlamydia psittaci NJ1]
MIWKTIKVFFSKAAQLLSFLISENGWAALKFYKFINMSFLN